MHSTARSSGISTGPGKRLTIQRLRVVYDTAQTVMPAAYKTTIRMPNLEKPGFPAPKPSHATDTGP